MKHTVWKRLSCILLLMALMLSGLGTQYASALTVRYFDPEPPRLLLQGSHIVLVIAGGSYTDPGYCAWDSYGNDLAAAVTVSGSVDTGTPGVYPLRYTVPDGRGGTLNACRTVYVVPPEDVPEAFSCTALSTGGTAIQPNGKTIYLTFDDGPSVYTEQLLDILAKYGVKASFFVIQSSHIPTIRRAAAEGHTVAIHSYSHRYSHIYANDAAFLADVQDMQDVIFQYTNQRTTLVRFPGGSSNTISSAYSRGIMSRMTKRLQAMGYRYFDWNVDSLDASSAHSPAEVFRNVVKGIGSKANAVVLQHDTQDFSVCAVEKIIVWGLCNGYTFLPLSNDSPACHHKVCN